MSTTPNKRRRRPLRATAAAPRPRFSSALRIRRYIAQLKRSIRKGIQWAAFKPNTETLWAKVRSEIADFLLKEWRSGALVGAKPEEAFFVKCDQSTMTQNDIDTGRLVCEIGVAPVYPAEFVILRIGQWTGSKT